MNYFCHCHNSEFFIFTHPLPPFPSKVMVANSLPELVEAMTSHALENDGVKELEQGKTKTWPV